MKAIVVEAPNQMRLQDVPKPTPGYGEVLIRTSYVGICATDFEILAGRIARIKYPHIPGHEWSGIVEAVGDSTNQALVGQRVTGENFITCTSCPACRQGRWNECRQPTEVGFDLPGGYGEFFVTKANLLRVLPETVGLAEASLLEPLAVSVFGIRRTGIELGDRVVIFGDGPIGLMCTQLARLRGARRIVLVGGSPKRLALAEQMGASLCINYHTELDVIARIAAFHLQTEVAIEASGNPTAFEQCCNLLTYSGRLGVFGDYARRTVTIDPTENILHKNLQIIGANASPGTWDTALALVVDRLVDLSPLVSAVYPIERYAEAFDAVRTRKDGAVKVVLSFVGESRSV